ncbi:carboxypeptidase-like regulatory domain-containing protein [Anseongella ginsenosidimutans]|uniref:carboxypeptidase-like regulatory domain-containing protein n=1 Tax=Anseongella ginsenosidimutans TaxID=496056 RepID=UPI001CEF5BD3|nr:carboxypeptidase-like regulatory domain-containing protein [Anseongella ginsenosidimutans]
MKHWLLLFLLSASLPAYAQAQPAGQRYTLSGYLKDAATGEALSGVTVSAGESGTASNNYGFYSLTLPRGRYTIRFSSIGFEPVSRVVELEGNLRVDQELQVAAGLLEEVVVSEEKKGGMSATCP